MTFINPAPSPVVLAARSALVTLVAWCMGGCVFNGASLPSLQFTPWTAESAISAARSPFPRHQLTSGTHSQAAGDGSVLSLSAVGEIVSLSDPRFTARSAQAGLWRPRDYVRTTRPGIYVLEAVDDRKTPVIFVHGINDSPASFAYLIERLDRSRFQPWVYSYPSGAHLDTVTDHLHQSMQEMRERYRFPAVAVVAHSMGGLVSRGFILRQGDSASSVPVGLFVSISTPWEGHEAARLGAKLLPAAVAVWRDIAPGSDYLKSLFATALPSGTPHYLLFTYSAHRTSFAATSDRTVTLASQLAPLAQRDATRLFGFNDTHKRVLRNEEVSSLLNSLLNETFDPMNGHQTR